MKKNIALAIVALSALTQTAFASGVEMDLPADAHNVKIAAVELDGVVVGETPLPDTSEGAPNSEPIYAPSLGVTVTYESTDTTDVPQATDGDFDPSTLPTRYLEIRLTDAQAAAIKAKKLDPRSLIGQPVLTKATVQEEDTSYEYKCTYDNDNNEPLYGCVEPPVPTVAVPVIIATFPCKN
jgi:hypothetical protein